MLELIKPPALKPGDKVAAVSLSWGGAGDKALLWRYEQGKRWIQEHLGLEVVEMPNTLKGSRYLYHNPQKRAEDLMQAFADPDIRGILTCTGGNDTIRLLPHIDFELIRKNPKVFTGFSDSTANHMMCLRAGLSSFYGPAVLTDFGEKDGPHPYTVNAFKKALFSVETIGKIVTSSSWTGEQIDWTSQDPEKRRALLPNGDYEVLQGSGRVQGPLIGGSFEVLNFLKGTPLFPPLTAFDGAIFFLETSEVYPPPWLVEESLRGYGAMGVLNRARGLLWGKPVDERYAEEYKKTIRKVLKELGLETLPVLLNASFGHNEPRTILPYGALAEINCEEPGFSILEPGVSSR